MNLEDINSKYQMNCMSRTDINEHLPTLKRYAEKVDHITEFGTCTGQSTSALLAGNPKKFITYDIYERHNPTLLLSLAKAAGIDFSFVAGDTREVTIEPTDLLFIDSAHNFADLQKELKLHGDKVSKYLIFHDTVTYGTHDEIGGDGPGLLPAIEEFLRDNPQWSILEDFANNNGLRVLTKA